LVALAGQNELQVCARPRPKVASTESPPVQRITGATVPQERTKETKNNKSTGTITAPANPATATAEQYDYE
jgi:hypothetical protein